MVTERYRYSHQSKYVKTIAKLREVTGFRTTHIPRLMNGATLVDGDLKELDNPINEVSPAYGYCQMNHYWNKSFEEFVAKRMRARGIRNYVDFFRWGNAKPGDLDPMPRGILKRIKQEMRLLLHINGVRGEVEEIERQFGVMLSAFDAEHNLERLYAEQRLLSIQR
jgi:hypothetical protein